MSRIGNKPVSVPSDVSVDVSGATIKVKGAKGELSQSFERYYVDIKVESNEVLVERKGDTKPHRARHGLYRALVANMVEGCSKGFKKTLEITGVGYNAKAAGQKLTMNIGFCHPVEFEMPAGVKVETPTNTQIVLTGPDKQMIGQLAANIRGVRPPEPYKGKGIRYSDEVIRRKAGKAVGGK
ncbi:MAG: 50S ribosomal protein L6 [Planctomycetes bacterium]|nr:50S ribosomal protein L6 [Planctomycetota bacterium]